MKPKTWVFYPENKEQISTLSTDLRVSEIVSRILINRGICDLENADSFLRPTWDALLDPDLLNGMAEATDRIHKAINNREKILIYGDFDADGITSTVLLLHLFKLLNTSISHYIPNRVSEGYAFTPQGLEEIIERKTDLVISVDSGISSYDEVAHLRKHNVDVIITDHHEPPDTLPPANAIINPKCKQCNYPFKHLSGVGVAFKLAWGIAKRFSKGKKVSPEFRQFLLDALAWVALGTIADLVPLKGENRFFAKYGLPAIQESKNPGLRALCDTIGISQRLTSEDISFRLGPRINASGRMGRVDVAIDLFQTTSYQKALDLASSLDDLNKTRQTVEKEIFDQVKDRISEPIENVIISSDDNWHQGVIGIVASKLVEEYGKPAILISFSNKDKGRGSCRSVPGFDIFQALAQCSDLLETYGGHSSAAGLQIRREAIEPFSDKIIKHLNLSMPDEDFRAKLHLDGEIHLSAVSQFLLSELDKLRPFGECNPEPIFASTKIELARPAKQVGRNSTHLSFYVRQGKNTFKCIAFSRGADFEKINNASMFAMAFTPKLNFYAGRSRIELEVKDIHYDE